MKKYNKKYHLTKKDICLTILGIITSIFLGVILFVSFNPILYIIANYLYNNEQYDIAAEIFLEISPYKDSYSMHISSDNLNRNNEVIDLKNSNDLKQIGKYNKEINIEQEKILNNLNEAAEGDIPGFQNIEYDEENKKVNLYLSNEEWTKIVAYTINNPEIKNEWDKIAGTFDNLSILFYKYLLNEGYNDLKSVTIYVENYFDNSKMLYITTNGTKVYDATDI